MRVPTGIVSLVGAGPGDPDLLTRRGADRLRAADIVFADALVSNRMRALAPAARWVDAGKRGGGPQVSQAWIVDQLIAAAQRGLRVVRLKGGDPFVFGRGGEEALALIGAGIAVEIVPGVSSAIAAPALAGIPVTHREVASGFIVLAGSNTAVIERVFSSVPAGLLTIVVLMSARSRASLSATAIRCGWPGRTPAAVVAGAATPQMSCWRGTLTQLGSAVIPELDAGLPGTIVIGEVATLPIDCLHGVATSEAVPA